MTIFVGLDEIIKCVIQNTAYCSASIEDQKIPDHERYHNVMKALFGDIHPDEYVKPPEDFEFSEILWAYRQKALGESFEGTIKKIASRKMKKPKKQAASHDEKSDSYYEIESDNGVKIPEMVDRVKKHIKRNKDFYEKRASVTDKHLPEEIFQDIENDKEKLRTALRELGWPL